MNKSKIDDAMYIKHDVKLSIFIINCCFVDILRIGKMNQYRLKPKERVPQNSSNQRTSIVAMKVDRLMFTRG